LVQPPSKLNFPDVESQQEAKFLAPSFCEKERENRQTYLQLRAHKSDKAAMARFRCEHPKFVQAKMKFYAARDA
jgi:hypothetical protein